MARIADALCRRTSLCPSCGCRHHDPHAGLQRMHLHLGEFDLQCFQLVLIVTALHLFVVRVVIGRQCTFFDPIRKFRIMDIEVALACGLTLSGPGASGLMRCFFWNGSLFIFGHVRTSLKFSVETRYNTKAPVTVPSPRFARNGVRACSWKRLLRKARLGTAILVII